MAPIAACPKCLRGPRNQKIRGKGGSYHGPSGTGADGGVAVHGPLVVREDGLQCGPPLLYCCCISFRHAPQKTSAHLPMTMTMMHLRVSPVRAVCQRAPQRRVRIRPTRCTRPALLPPPPSPVSAPSSPLPIHYCTRLPLNLANQQASKKASNNKQQALLLSRFCHCSTSSLRTLLYSSHPTA